MIWQLGADESPLSSLDHGMGERVPDHGRQSTPATTRDNATDMQVEPDGGGRSGGGGVDAAGMQMVNMHNTIGMGLAAGPKEGNVPLLQVCMYACMQSGVKS